MRFGRFTSCRNGGRGFRGIRPHLCCLLHLYHCVCDVRERERERERMREGRRERERESERREDQVMKSTRLKKRRGSFESRSVLARPYNTTKFVQSVSNHKTIDQNDGAVFVCLYVCMYVCTHTRTHARTHTHKGQAYTAPHLSSQDYARLPE